jgi:hypothetical protein
MPQMAADQIVSSLMPTTHLRSSATSADFFPSLRKESMGLCNLGGIHHWLR